ncbi:LuxR C-terminal-related transcriptional regulator [uncultured Nevskia sp.]|uniref:helix-turn-helix transcriptional regulator n=1 Tax=uncultured Nevskia sp. TaxID=228950 RepID=UPI0025D08D1E|nr:LuxR C-terminal-related transcriptional regulator [uncultured Nevskia sp.]
MNPGSDPAIVLSIQRRLRGSLLDCASAVPWAPARDLAAHLLLSLDDPGAGWRMSVEWLRDRFDVDRVEGGIWEGDGGLYTLGSAQARRRDAVVPSVRGIRMPMDSAVLCSLANDSAPFVLEDIAQARILDDDLRSDLIKVGTRMKIASSLHFKGATFGFLCMDHVHRSKRLSSTQFEQFRLVTGAVLGEILGAAHRLGRLGEAPTERALDERLTPAERKVLALLGSGLGYKRIAQQLGRSIHTVDHQLRSIRAKLKVHTNMQLLSLLSSAPAMRPFVEPAQLD